ncbi:redox-sensing transcriptional repressor Rex [bacterium DOLJORAL78_65_58]|nr:MAG: redox-sensing transcriptional repressor Rex [bacterium DOLZORAL124_64_63]PIE76167.1 MAG: redox-sensing transcriptional repressor Rex [bacterium DOLJORAL78_65_58]
MRKRRRGCDVPDATVLRLPLYLEKLKLLQAIGVEDVSSRQLAESLDIKASQLRHDFHYFGGFSQPGRPYQVDKLVEALEKIIGIAQPVPTAIVGAGHLGQALANYQNLELQGFPVRGIFDVSPKLIGQDFRGILVRGMDELEDVIRKEGIRIAILTVPAASAQAVTDRMVSAGVVGIFNFAPKDLKVPAGVAVRNERLVVGIMSLSFKVKCLLEQQAAAAEGADEADDSDEPG